MAGSLVPVMYWAVRTTLCNALWSEAKELLYSDKTIQHALDGAAAKPFEDLRTHAKSFQAPEGE